MFRACLPWVVGTHVMGRLIAQFVCYSVLPECATDVDGTHLEALFLFLRDNPEMVRRELGWRGGGGGLRSGGVRT